jgi:hypothetical protein
MTQEITKRLFYRCYALKDPYLVFQLMPYLLDEPRHDSISSGIVVKSAVVPDLTVLYHTTSRIHKRIQIRQLASASAPAPLPIQSLSN